MINNSNLLYQEILSSPHDDTLRLVYADAVEEEGEADLAMFVRGQVRGDVGPVTFQSAWKHRLERFRGNVAFAKFTFLPHVLIRPKITGRLRWIESARKQSGWEEVVRRGLRTAWLTVRRGFLDRIDVDFVSDWAEHERFLRGRFPLTAVHVRVRLPHVLHNVGHLETFDEMDRRYKEHFESRHPVTLELEELTPPPTRKAKKEETRCPHPRSPRS